MRSYLRKLIKLFAPLPVEKKSQKYNLICENMELVHISEKAYFAGNVTISCNARVDIGDYTMIAHGVIIHTSTHDYNDHPMWTKRIDAPIRIGNHVWIGINAIILPGVIVEDYAVIGAGSVITKNIPKGAIVAGNPARILRYRNDIEAASDWQMQVMDNEHATVLKKEYLSGYYE